MTRTLGLIVLTLLLASGMAGWMPGDKGVAGGTASGGDRSPQVLRVDDSGGQPFLTIQSAIDAASTGDLIRVYDGTYYENVTIDKGVHIIGNGSATTSISNDGTRDVFTVLANGFSIRGFAIGNSGKKTAGIALDRVLDGNVWDCVISCAGGGLYGIRTADGCVNNTIANCTITSANKAGVQLRGMQNWVFSNSFATNRLGVSVHGPMNMILDNTFDQDDDGVCIGYLPMDVLLMGNSYTYANNLDDILERQLDTLTTEITASRLAEGGLTLSDHANSASTPGHQWNLTLNDGRPWDAVVLQDQSQIPGFPTTHSSWQRSLDGARTLDGMIHDLGADTVFLMTWGRRDGDSTNPTLYPNFTAMQARLEAGYRYYAENLSTRYRPAYIAPAGLAFEWVHDYLTSQGIDPTTQGSTFYNLFASDGSHPSVTGSYLASCVLYATLTGNSPVGLKDGTSINPTLKALLQRAAEETVFINTTTYDYPWRRSWGNLVNGNVFEVQGNGLTIGCNADGNTVTNNSFSGGHYTGILVRDANSHDNTIHHNGFRDNNMGNAQGRDDWDGNSWDDGSQGNYWGDYMSRYPSATNDGVVWDTSYDIIGGGADRYPLVRFPAFEDLDPPEALAGSDLTVDEGVVVELDGRGSYDEVGIVNFTWTFEYDGVDVALHGSLVEFRFDVPGVYIVTLNVTDAAGNSGVDQVVITVSDTTRPTARISPTGPLDQHETVTLDGSRSFDNVGVVNWTWMFAYESSTVHLHGPVVDFVFDAAGRFTVYLTVADGAGNEGQDLLILTVRDVDPPFADAGLDMTVEMGTLVHLDASGSTDNVAIVSYVWTLEYRGEPVELEDVLVDLLLEDPGEYVIILAVRDAGGNDGTDEVLVTVRDSVPPSAEAGAHVTVLQGTLVTLDATNSTDNIGIARYLWTFDYDGSPVEGEGEVLEWTFDIMGRHHITLTVFDAAGLSDTDTVDVTVLDNVPPVADAGPDRTVDQGDEVTLDGSNSTDNKRVADWQWTFSHGGLDWVLEGKNVTFVFDIPGDYLVTLTVKDLIGHSDEDTLLIHVRDTMPPVPPTIGDVEVAEGGRVRMVASGAQDNVGIVKWTWTFEEGGRTWVLEGEEVEHVFEEAGEYVVTLTVEDAEGNSAREDFTVTVTGTNWLLVGLLMVAIVGALAIALVLMMRSRRGGGE